MKAALNNNSQSGPETEMVDELLDSLERKSSRPIAIFLGAGASKTFGYPLTRDLMFRILDGLRAGDILNERPRSGKRKSATLGKELHSFLTRLLPGERRSEAAMPMVTGVLSLLDFSLATNQILLPGTTVQETRRMRDLLERALIEVIPDLELWDPNEGTEESSFQAAQAFLTRIMDRRPKGKMALITTNYDMIGDLLAFHLANVSGDAGNWKIGNVADKVDFGFRWVNPLDADSEEVFYRPEKPLISLFKLHGSTNWLRCPLCENIYINPNGPIALLAGANSSDWDDVCHCSDTKLGLQIISPSFVREMREPNLIGIWKNTLDFLREADHWLMIGYSFPDEDVGIRALMTRAYSAKKTKHPEVSVVQLDDKARVNYESFFPPNTVRYVTGGFTKLLDRAKLRHDKPSRRSKS